MKYILLSFCLLGLTGCDTRADRNYGISVDSHYVNTTESINVYTYNGYKLVGSDVVENKDGSVVITLEIDKVISE